MLGRKKGTEKLKKSTRKEESTIARNFEQNTKASSLFSSFLATTISQMSTRFVRIIKSIYMSWHRVILIKAAAWPLTVCVRSDRGSYVRRNARCTGIAHSELGEAGLSAAALLDRSSVVAATCRCQDTRGRSDNTRKLGIRREILFSNGKWYLSVSY